MSTVAPPAPSPTPSNPAAKRKRFTLRRFTAGLCLVLATFLLPFSMISFWGQKTLTDTERFVQTVQPLASNPEIIEAIANTVATALTKNVDLEGEVKSVLPEKAQVLAGPISAAIPTFVKELTIKVLSTEQFQAIFTRTATALQTAIIKALSGETDGAVSVQGGQVVLDTGEVIDEVKKMLAARGLTSIADRPTPPAADRNIVLLNSEQVAQAQAIYKLTVPVATWMIAVVALLFLAAIALAHRRSRMVAYVGLGIIIGASFLRVALSMAPNFISNTFIGTPFEAASVVFFNTLTVYLKENTAMFIMIGLIMVIAGWLLSDQKYAVALRERVENMRNSDTPNGPTPAVVDSSTASAPTTPPTTPPTGA